MSELTNVGYIKSLMYKYNFSFTKSLGQNFLINPNICPQMVQASVEGQDWGAIEIGPGIGVLTVELCKAAKKVVSIEIDKKLIPVLHETLKGLNNLKLVNEDVLKINIQKLIQEEFRGMPVVVCANLPYYITSAVIMKILEERASIENITVMVQNEVAKRFTAIPGATRDGGAISLAVRYYADPEILFPVSRGSFVPKPCVDSSVIKLKKRKSPPACVFDEKVFFRLVKASFSQRRKFIINSISDKFFIPKETVKDILDRLNIDQTVRPERLLFEDFANVSNELTKIL